jgi:HAD superfamily hydrolase (TIGR01549 family)
LAARLAPHGYDPAALINSIWKGTAAMVRNDGLKTNEAVFWDCFASVFGEESRKDEPKFREFYETDFQKVQQVCGYHPAAREIIDLVKSKGLSVVLATNPIFPAIATEHRMVWAGLDKNDFTLYTTYENSSFCKPNPLYYQKIMDTLGVNASECMIVGNDATEDMVAQTLGMKVFLLTDCLINKKGIDLSGYPQGNLEALVQYIQSM